MISTKLIRLTSAVSYSSFRCNPNLSRPLATSLDRSCSKKNGPPSSNDSSSSSGSSSSSSSSDDEKDSKIETKPKVVPFSAYVGLFLKRLFYFMSRFPRLKRRKSWPASSANSSPAQMFPKIRYPSSSWRNLIPLEPKRWGNPPVHMVWLRLWHSLYLWDAWSKFIRL